MNPQRTQGDRLPSRLSKELRARGGAVYSTCTGFAYARNGNTHNPTPHLLWVGTIGGRVVSRAGSKKAVLETIQIALEG